MDLGVTVHFSGVWGYHQGPHGTRGRSVQLSQSCENHWPCLRSSVSRMSLWLRPLADSADMPQQCTSPTVAHTAHCAGAERDSQLRLVSSSIMDNSLLNLLSVTSNFVNYWPTAFISSYQHEYSAAKTKGSLMQHKSLHYCNSKQAYPNLIQWGPFTNWANTDHLTISNHS